MDFASSIPSLCSISSAAWEKILIAGLLPVEAFAKSALWFHQKHHAMKYYLQSLTWKMKMIGDYFFILSMNQETIFEIYLALDEIIEDAINRLGDLIIENYFHLESENGKNSINDEEFENFLFFNWEKYNR
ncbi:hypothetical protein BpHYR1_047766 [Brachionus plicatilis]|uniref:Uncharacterized protein n=1 Tax=Brachionus plicatilis TaxID=10195 RepID=A0A3M7T878_BRAPC|nr:hypothetical protein BpHYR1_047766 [Brachionus plicatilis]